MADYRLTPDAERDLLEITIYTIETWGIDQLDGYEDALTRCFSRIARGDAVSSTPLSHRPEIRATRCERHYIFSLHEPRSVPTIIAVLHETMDLMERLRLRLEGD